MQLTNKIKTALFFTALKQRNSYHSVEENLMKQTIKQLLEKPTTFKKPGMLLGEVQSGKTRAFIGVMGLAYDNGIDVVILLTKNSNALARQTKQRLESEFEESITHDKLAIYDITAMPQQLVKYELAKKLALVVKKEKNNLQRLDTLLFEHYPELSNKRILVIDDEADYASVSYEQNREKNRVELRVIANQIDEIRGKISQLLYLQVTATPYSLYLQPDDEITAGFNGYQPKRPAFTTILPTHDKYVGGELYFEKAKEKNHLASYLYHEITKAEIEIFKKSDKRRVKIDFLLTGERYQGIRSALINFIVGGKLRNLQQQEQQHYPEKYAFLMHTMTTKAAHQWQADIVKNLAKQLTIAMTEKPELFEALILQAYTDLERSLEKIDAIPTFPTVLMAVKQALVNEELLIEVVNSEKDVELLLDKSGQLKHRTPLNFFIGGQILDRGITIDNLIGFYYGRNPQKFQQDTVLQHSRMYGARPLIDIAVTRFYTTQTIYDVMEQMYYFDADLRQAIISGSNQQGVVFIQKDDNNQIIPCSPNKLLLSNIQMLKAHRRLLPIGFQTIPKSYLAPLVKKLDIFIADLRKRAVAVDEDDNRSFLVKVEDVETILEQIVATYAVKDAHPWDSRHFISALLYMSRETKSADKGLVWLVLRENRNMSRIRKSNQHYEDAPDTSHDELAEARALATDIPALILLRQNGEEKQGWKGGAFYWPVLITPADFKTTVYSKNTYRK